MYIYKYFRHEYQIFQKIQKMEYTIPDGFNPVARELVESLLVRTVFNLRGLLRIFNII